MNNIAELLHIHEKAHAHGPALSNIRDYALRELLKINADMAAEKPSTYVPTEIDKELAGTEAGGIERREL